MLRTVAVLCALAVVLGGCGRGDEPSGPTPTVEPRNSASSPSPNPTPEDAIACKMLTSKERRSVAGERLDAVDPAGATDTGSQCRWVESLTQAAPRSLGVTVLKAQDWAATFPSQVDRIIVGGRQDDKMTKRLLAAKKMVAEKADDLKGAAACDLFSLIAEANGLPKNKTQVLSYHPGAGGMVSAFGQTCTDGVYTALVYTELGLAPSPALNTAVTRLLNVAHDRAVKEL